MDAIWKIIIEPAWYWLFTIIPAVVGVIGVIQDNLPQNQRSQFIMQVYNFLPPWGWFIVGAIAFVVTILIGANNYVKSKRESQGANQVLAGNITTKSEGSKIQSTGQTGGMTGNITAHTIHQGDIYLPTKELDSPNIDIDGSPYIQNDSLNMSLHNPASGEIKPIFIPVLFAQLKFANNPKTRNADSTARNVRAKITYLRTNNSIIATLSGRWAGERGSQDEEIIDMLSNGKPRILYLAMKYNWEHDRDLYMYGLETDVNYFWNRHENDTYRIYDNQVDIIIEIIGERVELNKKFRLHNEETGLRIETLSEDTLSKVDKANVALQVCKLSQDFADKFEFIRYPQTQPSELNELSKDEDVLILRQKKAKESFRRLVDFIEPDLKYQFDCRRELEESLQKLSNILNSYSFNVYAWVDAKSKQEYMPRGVLIEADSFIEAIYGEAGNKAINEARDIVERIKQLLEPYIRHEK